MSREFLRMFMRTVQRRAFFAWRFRPLITASAITGAAAATYLIGGTSSRELRFSIFPQAHAHSAKEKHESTSHKHDKSEDSSAEVDEEEPKISVMYDFFREFASLEYKKERYMTPADFIESLVEDCPGSRRSVRVLSDRDLQALQKKTPSKKQASTRLFRNIGVNGIISYSDYIFLMHVLTKTERSMRVAFQVLDVDGNGNIDKKELLFLEFLIDAEKRLARFKAKRDRELELAQDQDNKGEESEWFILKLLNRAKVYAEQAIGNSDSEQQQAQSAHNDSTKEAHVHGHHHHAQSEDLDSGREFLTQSRLAHNYKIPPKTIDTTLQIHFFGKNGLDHLDFADFCKFVENLQYEALEAEFQRFAGNHAADCPPVVARDDVIHVRDFARILFRHTEYARYCNVALLDKTQKLASNLPDGEVDEVKNALELAMKYETSAQRLRSEFVINMTHRLDELKPESKHITFEQFARFHNIFKHLDDLKVAVRLNAMQRIKVTRSVFQRAFLAATGSELDPVVTDVLFKMFDVNQDGSLSSDEFLSVMRESVQRHIHIDPQHDHGHEEHDHAPADSHCGAGEHELTWDAFKSCLKSEIRKMK